MILFENWFKKNRWEHPKAHWDNRGPYAGSVNDRDVSKKTLSTVFCPFLNSLETGLIIVAYGGYVYGILLCLWIWASILFVNSQSFFCMSSSWDGLYY